MYTKDLQELCHYTLFYSLKQNKNFITILTGTPWSPSLSKAFLNASSNGFLFSSWNSPISSQFFRNFVGVGVWSEIQDYIHITQTGLTLSNVKPRFIEQNYNLPFRFPASGKNESVNNFTTFGSCRKQML